jgi:hypothetical protein
MENSMTSPEMPLTPSDLRDIADAVDGVEATELAGNPLLGRIELHRPDGDQIGWVSRFDGTDPDMGWGFVIEAGC